MVDEYDEVVDVEFPDDGGTPPWYIPPDRYVFQVTKAELKESERSGRNYIELELTTQFEGSMKHIAHRCSLKPEALWELQRTLSALGMSAKGRVSLALSEMIGKWLEAEVEDDTYQGRLKTEISNVFPLEGEPPDWEQPAQNKEEDEGMDFFGPGSETEEALLSL